MSTASLLLNMCVLVCERACVYMCVVYVLICVLMGVGIRAYIPPSENNLQKLFLSFHLLGLGDAS